MKHGILTAALVVTIAAGGSFALAESHGGHGGHGGPRVNFEEIDTNDDGILTKTELEAHRQAHFQSLDTSGDGLVSEAELRAGMKERADERIERRISRMFERHDANDDGQLSFDEAKARHGGRMFEKADTDGDGAISRAEFDAMKDKRAHRKNKG